MQYFLQYCWINYYYDILIKFYEIHPNEVLRIIDPNIPLAQLILYFRYDKTIYDNKYYLRNRLENQYKKSIFNYIIYDMQEFSDDFDDNENTVCIAVPINHKPIISIIIELFKIYPPVGVSLCIGESKYNNILQKYTKSIFSKNNNVVLFCPICENEKERLYYVNILDENFNTTIWRSSTFIVLQKSKNIEDITNTIKETKDISSIQHEIKPIENCIKKILNL